MMQTRSKAEPCVTLWVRPVSGHLGPQPTAHHSLLQPLQVLLGLLPAVLNAPGNGQHGRQSNRQTTRSTCGCSTAAICWTAAVLHPHVERVIRQARRCSTRLTCSLLPYYLFKVNTIQHTSEGTSIREIWRLIINRIPMGP